MPNELNLNGFADDGGHNWIRTTQLVLGLHNLTSAIKHFAIASVTGPPGTGKTSLLDHAEAGATLPVYRVEPSLEPTMRSITGQLLEELTGDPGRGSRHDRVPQVIAALATPAVVLVDEAQRLSKVTVDHLRFLHDHRRTCFALVFAGGEGCWNVLAKEPQLRRRIWRATFLGGHDDQAIVEIVPKLHPIWSKISEDDIRWVYHRIPHTDFGSGHSAGGIIGNWVSLTYSAAWQLDDPAKVDRPFLRRLLIQHGASPGSLK
jgi:hypothetical protein